MAEEAKLQRKILKYLNGLDNCWAFKAESVTRGVPDVVCCYKGFFVAFEVKASRTSKASKIQTAILCRINDACGYAPIVNNMEQVKTALKHIDYYSKKENQ